MEIIIKSPYTAVTAPFDIPPERSDNIYDEIFKPYISSHMINSQSVELQRYKDTVAIRKIHV